MEYLSAVLIIATIVLKIATAWLRRRQKHHKSQLPYGSWLCNKEREDWKNESKITLFEKDC